MSSAAAQSLTTSIVAVVNGIAYLCGLLQYPAIWWRIYKYGASGISVPAQLLLALSYIIFFFLPLLGPNPSILPYIPTLAFAFFFIPFPLYTLYLLHTRSRAVLPSSLSASERSQAYVIGLVCLVFALVFNYEWYGWGMTGSKGTGRWGLGWLYEILWAWATYLGAVGIWPQLAESETEGRDALRGDTWLMAYLGMLYLNASARLLGDIGNGKERDPLASWAHFFAFLLFTFYATKIFLFRSTSPVVSLPSFGSGAFERVSSWRNGRWTWPWRRDHYVALSSEEQPLYAEQGEAGYWNDERDENDRIRANSAAAAAEARIAAERARGALYGNGANAQA